MWKILFIFDNKNLGKLCCYLEDWRLKFKLYKAIEHGFFLTQIFPYKDRIVPFTRKYQSEKTLILTSLDSLLKDHMKNEFEEVRGPSSPHHFKKYIYFCCLLVKWTFRVLFTQSFSETAKTYSFP